MPKFDGARMITQSRSPSIKELEKLSGQFPGSLHRLPCGGFCWLESEASNKHPHTHMTTLEQAVNQEMLKTLDSIQDYIAEERARKSKELTVVERMAWELFNHNPETGMKEALTTAKAFYEICLMER